MYGPSGIKAYTVSLLDILLEVDIIEKEGRLLSGKDYYRNLLQFEYQKRKHRGFTQGRYTDRDGSSLRDTNKDIDIRPRRDSDNDRDIRPMISLRQFDHRYAVPTFNRFNHLNW